MNLIIKVAIAGFFAFFFLPFGAQAQNSQEQICKSKSRNKTGCVCAVQSGGTVRENGNWDVPRHARQTFAACVEKNGGSMR